MADTLLLFVFLAGVTLAVQALHSHKTSFKIMNLVRLYRRSIPGNKQPTKLDHSVVSQSITSYQFPPLRVRTSTRMAMGLKRLDESNWLTIDPNYLPEHTLRLHLVKTSLPNIIQCLPPSIAACHEVLELVVNFLTSRFPLQFTMARTIHGPVIRNHITGEVFTVGPKCPNPLQIAALLSMEDFNILMLDAKSGEYRLQASATLFPAGWKLKERIGTSLARLHAPVPGWKEKLGAHVNRYFDHLSPRTTMERTSLFIQTTPALFQDEPESLPSSSSPDTIALLSSSMLPGITVRRERQTFTRLLKTNAVLFTVRTYMTPLVELCDEELIALRSQIWGWEEDVRSYKGFDLWGQAVEAWCDERLGKKNSSITVAKGGCPV